MSNNTVEIKPGTILQGKITPPGDKSISHRLILLASLAEGRSVIRKFLRSDDCLRTLEAMKQMGVSIVEKSPDLEIQGVGLRGLKSPGNMIYTGNSGTTTRLLMGVLAGQPFKAVLDGDESIKTRPMKRVTEPLKQMGAVIQGRDNGNYTPLTIEGGKLKAIHFINSLASAQVKSAVLLAGLFSEGIIKIEEPRPSRDHTERLLQAMGVDVRRQGNVVALVPPKKINPIEMTVPGDISSAAFWLAAGAIQPGKTVTVENVGLNPTRIGFVKVLSKMGANIQIETQSEIPEPIGTIIVTGGLLNGVTITRDEVPSLIDELPLLMVLGSLAKGKTVIRGAEELRVKETDRIKTMVKNLMTLGVSVKEYPDGVEIEGKTSFDGGEVDSFMDHRIAMSMAIAALRAKSAVKIKNADCVDISYPEFFTDFRKMAGN